MLVKFIKYLRCLFWHAVFKDALDDAAPIRMSWQSINLSNEHISLHNRIWHYSTVKPCYELPKKIQQLVNIIQKWHCFTPSFIPKRFWLKVPLKQNFHTFALFTTTTHSWIKKWCLLYALKDLTGSLWIINSFPIVWMADGLTAFNAIKSFRGSLQSYTQHVWKV